MNRSIDSLSIGSIDLNDIQRENFDRNGLGQRNGHDKCNSQGASGRFKR